MVQRMQSDAPASVTVTPDDINPNMLKEVMAFAKQQQAVGRRAMAEEAASEHDRWLTRPEMVMSQFGQWLRAEAEREAT